MKLYQLPNPEIWQGRKTGTAQYLHEAVAMLDMNSSPKSQPKGFALLGYACDEGVKRNQGRVGAKDGPLAIKEALGKLPCPLDWSCNLFDAGQLICDDQDMEATQKDLSKSVHSLLSSGYFPLVLGGGHDIAYGHFSGVQDYLGPGTTLGIINLDAHFDLRNNAGGNNSGTPFYQIAQEQQGRKLPFHYLCLGIREDANPTELFETAKEFRVSFVKNTRFNMRHTDFLKNKLQEFFSRVDRVYLTIDLDGFSSAYAPGVSAASPFGFDPDIAIWALEEIIRSGKLISMDIAELNPIYDKDGQTAKLAAGLLHQVLRHPELL